MTNAVVAQRIVLNALCQMFTACLNLLRFRRSWFDGVIAAFLLSSLLPLAKAETTYWVNSYTYKTTLFANPKDACLDSLIQDNYLSVYHRVFSGLELVLPGESDYTGPDLYRCQGTYIDGPYLGQTTQVDWAQPPLMLFLDRTTSSKSCARYGNPIDADLGSKTEVVDLLAVRNWPRIRLSYESSPKAPTSTPLADFAAPARPYFGELWQSSFHRFLSITTPTYSAQVRRGDGRLIGFFVEPGGVFRPDANVNDRLVQTDAGYRFTDADERTQETYTNLGVLTRVDSASGAGLRYAYSTGSTPASVAPGGGYLLSVTDRFGRSVQFTYDTSGHVNRIIDPAGQSIMVGYVNGNLAQLTWQDANVLQYLHENAAFTWALTGIVDERGLRKSTYGYDSAGRAVSTELAGGVNRYSVSYGSAPAIGVVDTHDPILGVVYRIRTWQSAVAPVVSTPMGGSIDLGVTMVANNPVVTSHSQPGGSGCAASTSNLSHDANGNVAVEDDFNGNRVCRSHDPSRNLETVRVEGLPTTQSCPSVTGTGATLPSGSRKISSQWHPNWRLTGKVAEPGRITTLVYNGQPDPFNGGAVASCAPAEALLPDSKPIVVLCKKVEQASTDADGSLGFSAALQAGVANKAWQWTYNQYGQVLTEKDALNNTTTYAYYSDTAFTGADPNAVGHTIGDLASVTNAKGQVTSYPKYNKHGQLLRMTGTNGLITDYAYDLRQRLTSVSVSGQTTTYVYDAAGQLLKATQPDTSWIGFEYDAAHRQTAVKDNLGNRIEHVLDNAGNKTGQSVKDSGGNLARSLSRSIDALGRVQQESGQQ